MKRKDFFVFAGIVFGTAAILHLIRSIMQWDLVLNNFPVPFWLSWLLVVVAGFLCFWSFKLWKEE
jgi:uncharacterized membrane protein YhaH (DUF805 family)